MNKYDLIVIGGGPGGYVAAIKAAQLGGKVAVVEKEKLGGVCLNWGCIPTKTLLKTAKLYEDILRGEEFGIVGIDNSDVKVDWNLLSKRKDKVVKKLVSGIYMLFKKNKVDLFEGMGKVLDKNKVEVNGEVIIGDNLIIATGAKDNLPPIDGLETVLESGKIINSKGALQLEEIPKDLVIVGGGVIAVEFATLFNSLGSKVTLIQRSNRILSSTEKEMVTTLQKYLIRKGINIVTDTKLKSVTEDGVLIDHKGEEKLFKGDKYLISLGLKPQLKGIENLNLELDSKGFVKTNERMETNIKGVYAIGDLNGKFALAHVASAEGIVAAENIMGRDSTMNYNIVPSCIYTFPELASVGLTEEEAKEKGYDITVSKFPLAANGKALAEGETLGFAKIISDNKYGEILGVHIMASNATDMISEAIVAMQIEGTVYDVAKAIHPHPTLSEIVMEAAFGAVDKPIHI
ncbi:Dihydrolipoyl dehydrogenase [[Clostridium] ultunense Esp]|uniref:Dihydrolipoyl dehydrogenase n=1 Tax=[Clostridium] ultunense Esp TaxID=1288971 RepID=M1ZKJ5_9FIRM|nr:dihydrolipoyl dehydrogenase [Schnuerera ultunensis]CCQ95562.1 Dihydrolipoyl dehydrogenase [[Clostridium] ultunense Esp]SHD78200.1 Dihydrolipoyl dehydrogenase [[Clostridium] ultunense Esp]